MELFRSWAPTLEVIRDSVKNLTEELVAVSIEGAFCHIGVLEMYSACAFTCFARVCYACVLCSCVCDACVLCPCVLRAMDKSCDVDGCLTLPASILVR